MAYGNENTVRRGVEHRDVDGLRLEQGADALPHDIDDGVRSRAGSANAWPISLITASSAASCSVSARSRFVSSNSRAFSSAVPIASASVLNSRSSASLKACSLRSSRMTTPMARSPAMIGTPSERPRVGAADLDPPAATVSCVVPKRSGWRVVRIVDTRPGPSGIRGSTRTNRLPSSMSYGNVIRSSRPRRRGRWSSPRPGRSCRMRSPTSSMMAVKSSLLASAARSR